jgi:hypothetical protein
MLSTKPAPLLTVPLLLSASLVLPRVVAAQDAPGSGPAAAGTDGKKLISLLDAEPSLYNGIIRYPKYYGDPAMVRGDLFERSHLLGDWGGARDDLAASGLTFDLGLTQIFQGVVSGDSDDDTRYTGSVDLWLGLDTGRAGLWSGGVIFAHAEANWSDPLGGTGALLPLNADAIAPGEPDSIALSEIYIAQALSEQVLLVAGKVDWAAWADTSLFANNERTQFLYEGLNNTPLLGPFVPYTSWGFLMPVQIAEEHALIFTGFQNAGSATVSGFDDLRIDEMTFATAYAYTPTFGDLPGLYEFILGYTSKDSLSFAVSERYLLGEILGVLPTITEDDNYGFMFAGSQYLWVREGAQRKRSDPVSFATARRDNSNPVGFGLTARFGILPSDRNVIDQFYSIGIAGWGGFPGRDDDNWGVAWAGSHISSDFRDDTSALGFDLDDFEHGVEAFYNFALTPAAHLSGHCSGSTRPIPRRTTS